jgi:hypothetical protein
MLTNSLFQLLIVSLHCACGLHLPEAAHSTTPSAIDEQEAAQSGIHTDLVAPAASSRSQFYQPHSYPNLPLFHALQQDARQYIQHKALAEAQHQAQLSPFLYTGPLIMIHPGDSHTISHQLIVQPKEPRDIDHDSPAHGPNTYILYRPHPVDNPQFVDMLPPTEEQEEPNYYGIKPKKTKKYSADGEKKKPKKGKNLKEQAATDDEEEADYDSAEEAREHREGETSLEESAPASRLDFQMHGN